MFLSKHLLSPPSGRVMKVSRLLLICEQPSPRRPSRWRGAMTVRWLGVLGALHQPLQRNIGRVVIGWTEKQQHASSIRCMQLGKPQPKQGPPRAGFLRPWGVAWVLGYQSMRRRSFAFRNG